MLIKNELYLGGNIAATIMLRQNMLSQNSLDLFRQKCLDFSIESLKQIKARFPFQERKQIKSLIYLNPESLLDQNIKRKLPSIAGVAVVFPGNQSDTVKVFK